jgi:hypothetical protein
MYLMAPMDPNRSIEEDLRARHAGYYRSGLAFRWLYYSLRLIAGLAAALLPFTISYSQFYATFLSDAIALATAVDTIFAPKERAKIYSRATDLLWVAQVKEQGRYEQYKDRIEQIMKTESEDLSLLIDVKEMLERIEREKVKK